MEREGLVTMYCIVLGDKEGLITNIAQSIAQDLTEELLITTLIKENIVQYPLRFRISLFRKIMVDVGWDPRIQISIVFRGKEDWATKRLGGKICVVLEVNELRLREDTREDLT